MEKYEKKLHKNEPKTNDNGEWYAWEKKNHDGWKDNLDVANKNKNYRDIYGISAGVFAIAGAMTFIF
jgi:hypothetical protein